MLLVLVFTIVLLMIGAEGSNEDPNESVVVVRRLAEARQKESHDASKINKTRYVYVRTPCIFIPNYLYINNLMKKMGDKKDCYPWPICYYAWTQFRTSEGSLVYANFVGHYSILKYICLQIMHF